MKSKSDLLKTNEDIAPQCRQFYRCLYGGGRAQSCSSPSPPSEYKRLSILATLQSYIFARLGRTTFSFGNVTATEIKIKLVLVLDMCQKPWKKKVSPSSTAVTLLR